MTQQWKLVPVEPTPKMIDATWNDSVDRDGGIESQNTRNRRIYAAMVNAAPTPPASAQPERDWELSCFYCNGSGHVFVKRQVAELATDVQEFKEDCEGCDGRGFNIAFEDIPGIEAYVKSCHPASASAQDDAKDERKPLFWYRPRSDDGYEGPIHNDRIEDVRKQSGSWVPLYPGFATLPKPLYDLRYHGEFIRGWNQCLREVSASVAAPAAGDALRDLNADLIEILGRPNFTCIRIAQLLRLGGVEIAKKAEAEQATVIHYLLGFYLKHGSQWHEKANEDIERRRITALAASQQQEG